MNIHIVKWTRVAIVGIRVFTHIDSLDSVLDHRNNDYNRQDVVDWVDGQELDRLPFEDTYAFKSGKNSAEEDAEEYILTEKQSALFLLRFK